MVPLCDALIKLHIVLLFFFFYLIFKVPETLYYDIIFYSNLSPSSILCWFTEGLLTSSKTLLFHGALLILGHKMPPTDLNGCANIVFQHFHMHYYFGYTAIPPVHHFTLWLTFKLWAMLVAYTVEITIHLISLKNSDFLTLSEKRG